MLEPIKPPKLIGSLSNQLSQIKEWPLTSHLTVVAAFTPRDLETRSSETRYGETIVDELIRYKDSLKRVTKDKIYNVVKDYVYHTSLSMKNRINGLECKWYTLNAYMLRSMFMSILPAILGKDVYDANTMIIHEILRLPPAKRHFVGVCSRQVGKTRTAITALAAAAISMIRKGEIDLYAQYPSTRSNNARDLIDAIAGILNSDPEIAGRFEHVRGTVANDSVIEFYNSEYKCTILIRMRTGTGEDMRGVIGVISFVDEFAFLEDDVMKHIQVIRSTRKDAHLIMVTTYGAESVSAKFAYDVIANPGKFFNNGQIFSSSFVCDSCKLLPDQTKCEHMIGYFPPWRDVSAAMDDIRNAEGNPVAQDLARRELLGIASSGHTYAISSVIIESVFNSPRYVLPHGFKPDPPVLWFSIDPSSGMETSSFSAKFCVCGKEGQRFFLGGESFITVNMQSDEIHRVIIDCLSEILKVYSNVLEGCAISWMYEANNNATMASNFANTMRIYCSMRGIPIDDRSIYGDLARMARGVTDKMHIDVEGIFWSRNENKNSGLNEWIKAANKGLIRFCNPFITTGTTSFSQVSESSSKRQKYVEGEFKSYGYQREIAGSEKFCVDRYINANMEQMRSLKVTSNGGLSGKGNKKPLKHDDIAIADIILFEGMSKLIIAREC